MQLEQAGDKTMTIFSLREAGLRRLATLSLCVLCCCLNLSSFAADTPDMQRARQLREKQENGQPLTNKETTFLKQAHAKLEKDREGGTPHIQTSCVVR
jgi:hypothetical protein